MSDEWSEAYDDEGNLYYYHNQTGETAWELPAAAEADAGDGSAGGGSKPGSKTGSDRSVAKSYAIDIFSEDGGDGGAMGKGGGKGKDGKKKGGKMQYFQRLQFTSCDPVREKRFYVVNNQ